MVLVTFDAGYNAYSLRLAGYTAEPAVAYSQQCWAVILFGGRVALRNARVRADRRLLGRLAGKHILELHHYALRDQIRNCRL